MPPPEPLHYLFSGIHPDPLFVRLAKTLLPWYHSHPVQMSSDLRFRLESFARIRNIHIKVHQPDQTDISLMRLRVAHPPSGRSGYIAHGVSRTKMENFLYSLVGNSP